jgi:hypothetical protein
MESTVSRVGRKVRRRRGPAVWKKEVRAWKESGLAAAEYAAKHDLSPSTLMWWSSAMKRPAHGGRSRTEKRGVPSASVRA